MNALDVRCPYCGAKPQRGCTSGGMLDSTPYPEGHNARRDYAKGYADAVKVFNIRLRAARKALRDA